MEQKAKTREEIETILDRITWPGGRSHRLLDKGDGFLLQLTYDETCVVSGRVEKQHTRKWYISPFSTETEIVETAWAAVQRSVLHQAAEWFRYCGARVYSPHLSIDARMTAATTWPEDKRDNGGKNGNG